MGNNVTKEEAAGGGFLTVLGVILAFTPAGPFTSTWMIPLGGTLMTGKDQGPIGIGSTYADDGRGVQIAIGNSERALVNRDLENQRIEFARSLQQYYREIMAARLNAMCDSADKMTYVTSFIDRMREKTPVIRGTPLGKRLTNKPTIHTDFQKLAREGPLDSYFIVSKLRDVVDKAHHQLRANKKAIAASIGSIQNTNSHLITKSINDAGQASIGTFIATAEITEAVPGLFCPATAPISATIIAEAVVAHYGDIIDFTYGIYRACVLTVNNQHWTKQRERLERDYERAKADLTDRENLRVLSRFVDDFDRDLSKLRIDMQDAPHAPQVPHVQEFPLRVTREKVKAPAFERH